MIKQALLINIIFIIGIIGAWASQALGNVVEIYEFLLLMLIPLNIFIIVISKKKKQ